jgi:hypothetical protein
MTTKKISVRAAVRDAKREDKAARERPPTGSGSTLSGVATADSFVNMAHKLGVGADNALSSSTYGYNPITRNRTLLEWIHRGSWLGGVAIDIVADDMTRAGVDFLSELKPGDGSRLDAYVEQQGCWAALNDAIKWARLYGGGIAVHLVDGQDPRTPLQLDRVGRDQYKGMIALDRWMVDPSLEDLVTDYGAHLGLPKFYRVQANAPSLRGAVIHHSRVAFRSEGIRLPYNQRLTENMWGISVLERLYDRMIAFDSASTGAAQLVFKAHLRTMSIEGLRDIVAAGGPMMDGLMSYVEVMRRFQGIEGITLLDSKDLFEVQGSGSAFSGVGDIVSQLADQLAGALQIPKTRLFGQSPGGMSGGKDDAGERTYYDGIRQGQNKDLRQGVTSMYLMSARSQGIALPDGFGIAFASLYDIDDTEKADIAQKVTETVTAAKDAGLVSQKTVLQELRQSSRTTGVWTNITEAEVEAADDEITPPVNEMDLALLKTDADKEKQERDLAAQKEASQAQDLPGASRAPPRRRAKLTEE